MNSLKKAEKAVEVLYNKKANDITCMDLTDVTIFSDYFVICFSNSITAVKAFADEIHDKFKENEISIDHIEGRDSSQWILVDCIDIVIHILYKETREYYKLERLWSDSKEVDMSHIINK